MICIPECTGKADEDNRLAVVVVYLRWCQLPGIESIGPDCQGMTSGTLWKTGVSRAIGYMRCLQTQKIYKIMWSLKVII